MMRSGFIRSSMLYETRPKQRGIMGVSLCSSFGFQPNCMSAYILIPVLASGKGEKSARKSFFWGL